ncbi:hypothetical protein ST47_g4959 [Ascochyta rabiei]|uniref:Uncharacterized protein n=1 Tax=Didymella rabiei TaxID=5454 RepID=A0A163EW54_DIDRA|nr:hypothetical protein ST47_g4959 [Ascochyta rabiei]
MRVEMHPLPCVYSRPNEASLYALHNDERLVYISYDLIRLHQEKNVLSKGLADCVTYLKALREKQANHACRISAMPVASQKKRKRMQQTRRHLDNEIKNRERDEEAFLDNLQTCEANIFLTNMKAYHAGNASHYATELASHYVTELASHHATELASHHATELASHHETELASHHAAEFASTPTPSAPTLCSCSESESTDLTWDGWTDEAAASPLQKRSSNPLFVDDVAPDACLREARRSSVLAKRPPRLSRDAAELPESIPVPPNTGQWRMTCSSMLDAAAAVFRPSCGRDPAAQLRGCSESKLNVSSTSIPMATSCAELVQKRRVTAADTPRTLRGSSIDGRPVSADVADRISRSTSPQQSLQEARRRQMSRQRTKSV